jgi:hypothetical protein
MAREQGAGDAIQFARYLPLAAERVGRPMLVCRAELMPLFATLPGIAEIREPGTFQVAEFDTYTPLLSLPHLFGTILETIPTRVPYLDMALLRRRKAIALPPPPAAPRQDRSGLGGQSDPPERSPPLLCARGVSAGSAPPASLSIACRKGSGARSFGNCPPIAPCTTSMP